MKRFTGWDVVETMVKAVLLYGGAAAAILLIACGISYAADTELTISGSYSDVERGAKFLSVGAELLAPLGPILIGPTFEYADASFDFDLPPGQLKKQASVDVDGFGFGAALEWNITGETYVPFVGASATYWTGDMGDLFDYSVAVRGGVKVGTGSTFLKVQFSVGKDFGGGGIEDRDRDQAFIGFGKKF